MMTAEGKLVPYVRVGGVLIAVMMLSLTLRHTSTLSLHTSVSRTLYLSPFLSHSLFLLTQSISHSPPLPNAHTLSHTYTLSLSLSHTHYLYLSPTGLVQPSMAQAAKNLYGVQGIGGFYRGIEANVMRAMVLNGTKMSCYDQIKVRIVLPHSEGVAVMLIRLFPFSCSPLHSYTFSLPHERTLDHFLFTHCLSLTLPHTHTSTLPLSLSTSLTHSHTHSLRSGHYREIPSHPSRSPHSVLRCLRSWFLHGLHWSSF